MPLTSTGHGLALGNAGNGKVGIAWDATGNPAMGDDQSETVFSLLLERPWWGDPSGKRRSQLPDVKSRDAGTGGKIEQYARDALQPAIDDGRLQSVTPTAQAVTGGYILRLEYVTGAGRPVSLTVPLSV